MSDLEQQIKEAAEQIGYADPREWGALTCAANILALLADKDAEIERLKDGMKGLQEELKEVAVEARWAERQGEDYGSY